MNTDGSEQALAQSVHRQPTKYEGRPHSDLTEKIIGAAYEVHRELGGGFLESVYENALAIELRCRGLRVGVQDSIAVRYKGELVGSFIADLVVNEAVLCEIKAVESLHDAHAAQLLNYLKATGTQVGLLLNFGPRRVRVKRMIV
jgi:GxxExxY protein